jgi:putative redox protein
MSGELTVRHLDADRFAIDIRGHTLTVDQPKDAGGEDTAPTPTELFVAVSSHCTVHNTLEAPPKINITVEAEKPS